jgi:hypothetical protein
MIINPSFAPGRGVDARERSVRVSTVAQGDAVLERQLDLSSDGMDLAPALPENLQIFSQTLHCPHKTSQQAATVSTPVKESVGTNFHRHSHGAGFGQNFLEFLCASRIAVNSSYQN